MIRFDTPKKGHNFDIVEASDGTFRAIDKTTSQLVIRKPGNKEAGQDDLFFLKYKKDQPAIPFERKPSPDYTTLKGGSEYALMICEEENNGMEHLYTIIEDKPNMRMMRNNAVYTLVANPENPNEFLPVDPKNADELEEKISGGPKPRSVQQPDSAFASFKNTAMGRICVLHDGKQIPKNASKKQQKKITKKNRRLLSKKNGKKKALFLCHIRNVEIDKVPTSDWVLQDASALTRGSVRKVMVHKETAKLMDGHDVAFKVVPHPTLPGEVEIARVWVCYSGTLETLPLGDDAPVCMMCDNPSVDNFSADGSFFCCQECQVEAYETGVYDERQRNLAFQEQLIQQAARVRKDPSEALAQFEKDEQFTRHQEAKKTGATSSETK